MIGALTKNAWVELLKDKKAKTVLHGFTEIVNKFKRKPNKLWDNQGKKIIIALCEIGWMITTFSYTRFIMKVSQ